MKKWLKAFVHNALVHPLMMFMPEDMANSIHERNAIWAFDLNWLGEHSE